MGDAHPTLKVYHMAGMKDIAHQAAILAKMHTMSLTGNDAGRILTPVLEDSQSLVKLLINFLAGNDAGNTTHDYSPY
jgi:hypothetical protein